MYILHELVIKQKPNQKTYHNFSGVQSPAGEPGGVYVPERRGELDDVGPDETL